MRFVKAHAYGNDFLLVEAARVPGRGLPALTRDVCDRRRGLGADGLMVYTETADGATMRLINADGSASEISGNGIRCLAAWLAAARDTPVGGAIVIGTAAGPKPLVLAARDGSRLTFRAAMGPPTDLARVPLEAGGERVDAITLRIGNPQCVVLGEVTADRLHRVASALAVHPHFAAGTNVELATVEAPDRVRILIWERGVGPTEASGTGACAAATAAAAYGGASRDVSVVSPGGAQRVEWREDGLYLTGWAEVVATAEWMRA